EDLMLSLTTTRDENLLTDIDASLRLAQQQMQLTGSPEPLLTALRAADQRLARAAQPRLARLRAAIARDLDRIKAASVTDVPGAWRDRPGEEARVRGAGAAAAAVVAAVRRRGPRGGARPGAREPHRPARGGAARAGAGLLPAREPQAQAVERASVAARAADRS